jgi:hypothetical protein
MTRGIAVIVPAGTKGADAAYPPDPSTWDFEWCGRYVSTPDSNSKNLTEAEITRVAVADKGLAYFVEQAEGTPVNSTLDDDKALAKQAVKLANRFGLPKLCPFWYAVDTSPFGHFDVIAESFRVYRDLSDGWPVAAYVGSQCGEYLVDLGLIDYFHIPSAASWSETSDPQNGTTVVFGYRDKGGRVHNMYISPLASLRQYPSEPFAGSRIDRNDTLLPTPMWFPGRDEAPPVPPHEDPQEEPVTDTEIAKIIAGVSADTRAQINGFLGGDPGHAREGEYFNNLRALLGIGAPPATLVSAIVAALPAGGAGGLTEQQVTNAVLSALRKGTG